MTRSAVLANSSRSLISLPARTLRTSAGRRARKWALLGLCGCREVFESGGDALDVASLERHRGRVRFRQICCHMVGQNYESSEGAESDKDGVCAVRTSGSPLWSREIIVAGSTALEFSVFWIECSQFSFLFQIPVFAVPLVPLAFTAALLDVVK